MNLQSSISTNKQTRPSGSARRPRRPRRVDPPLTATQAAPHAATPTHRTGSSAMSKRKLRSPSNYDVGYGRPPKETRFRPGQSGNPTGYRKGSKTIGARLRELMNSKVTVTEHGRTHRISRLDVMLRQLTNDAMRGSCPGWWCSSGGASRSRSALSIAP